MNIFDVANSHLESFIKNNLGSYHKLRNYDFGIKNKSNVSQISKFTTHRILNEYYIIKRIKKVDIKKKYTDEILWKIYWKGYLEKHKSIWLDYKFNNDKKCTYDLGLFENAIHGETGIECFDYWVEELMENNYLHNHSRMWFASIWIFTLKLPWKLGANFFMRHLLDGDAASNTLSWRWVAGLHTNKKPYLASTDNIKKYTLNRFKNYPNLLSKEEYKAKDDFHISNNIPNINNTPSSKILIVFDNDLGIFKNSILVNAYANIYIVENDIIEDGFKVSSNVYNFKNHLISNINRFVTNSKIITAGDLNLLLDDHKNIDVIYPGVGNNLDLIQYYSKIKNIFTQYIYRDEDLIYWKNANAGFFKFKKAFWQLSEKIV